MSELFSKESRKHYVYVLFCGIAMGSADIVPGVSGGTMAFILGIYEELIQSIRAAARPTFLKAVVQLRLKDALEAVNAPFLAALATGIFLAVLTLAQVLEWALEHYPTWVWSFFFGLVAASVWLVGRRVQTWKPSYLLIMAISTLFTFLLVGSIPAQTPHTLPWLFFSGMAASVAMILPGISGAFILVLLGKYQYILGAVNDREVFVLGTVGLGVILGLVTISQILGWLFKRYHDLTVALLTGFLLGSLRKLWPWKEALETVVVDDYTITLREQMIWPQWGGETAVALGLMLLGAALVALLERQAAGNRADTQDAPSLFTAR